MISPEERAQKIVGKTVVAARYHDEVDPISDERGLAGLVFDDGSILRLWASARIDDNTIRAEVDEADPVVALIVAMALSAGAVDRIPISGELHAALADNDLTQPFLNTPMLNAIEALTKYPALRSLYDSLRPYVPLNTSLDNSFSALQESEKHNHDDCHYVDLRGVEDPVVLEAILEGARQSAASGSRVILLLDQHLADENEGS